MIGTNRPTNHPLIVGARFTSLGTLICRVLGMLRGMATALLLGFAGGGIMDAFAIALRIPNLSRRLFAKMAFMPEGAHTWTQVTRVITPIVAGAAAYGIACRLLGGRELGMLLGKGGTEAEEIEDCKARNDKSEIADLTTDHWPLATDH